MKILTNEDICLLLEWKINKESAVPSWVMPNGKIVPTPPLTTSLDIQEKYLWPWLNKKYGIDYVGFNIMFALGTKEKAGEHIYLCTLQKILHDAEKVEVAAEAINKDPATAFNLALSELVNV